MKKPNLLFIMTDQQRWDTLGVNGNHMIKTPHLDYLGRNGVLSDYAFVQNPVCVPSRCTIFTGRYPTAHGSRNLKYPLDRREINLFDILKDQGYKLGLSGKNHFLDKERLYNTFDSVYERGHQKTVKEGKGSTYYAGIEPVELEEYNTCKVTKQGIDFIQSHKDEPFALLLSFGDPHTPYSVPEPYASMYKPEDMKEPVFSQESLSKKPIGLQLTRKVQEMEKAAREDILKMKAIYYGMVTLIDESIGRVMQTIQQLGLEENTLIVFTTDHGDYMGDYGLCRKSYNFYDCLVHVPLIFYWKGRLQPVRISGTMVESTDIMPTLLDYMDIFVPEGVQGKSLRKYLEGECEFHRESVFSTAGFPQERQVAKSIGEYDAMETKPTATPYWQIGAYHGNMVRTMEWKFCYYNSAEGELYHLPSDPDEMNNLYQDEKYKDVKNHMMEELLKKLMDNQDPLAPKAPSSF